MGFGQLVPLLLMALPVLAAGEVYFGESKRRVHKERWPVNYFNWHQKAETTLQRQIVLKVRPPHGNQKS